MEYHIKPSGNQYYFTIISPGNHETLATSERYWNKADALNTIKLIALNGASLVDET